MSPAPRPGAAAGIGLFALALVAAGFGVRREPEVWRPPGLPPAPAPRPAAPAPAVPPPQEPPGSLVEEEASFAWPLRGEILSRYGAPRGGRRHAGVDIRGRRGEPVLAAAAGTVVFSGTLRGYGRTVILSHGDGYETLYAHNADLLVGPGDEVVRGQPVATVGRTGNATTEHCHFEIQVNGAAVDPLTFLEQDGGG